MDNHYSHPGESGRGSSAQKAHQQSHHMPLKLLILSELDRRQPSSGGAVSPSHGLSLDKSNFEDILENFKLRLLLKVPNQLAEQPKELTVALALQNMRSFRPESLAEQVPELKSLLEMRALVEALRDRKVSRQAFEEGLSRLPDSSGLLENLKNSFLIPPDRAAAQAPPPAPHEQSKAPQSTSPESSDELARILTMVETSEPASGEHSRAAALVERVAARIASSHQPGEPVDRQSADTLIAALDTVLTAQTNEILHHPQFRALESSWRGLKFLLDRTDFEQHIKIEILSCGKSALLETFDRCVLQPAYEEPGTSPVSIILAEYEFENSLQDRELLQQLAQKAEMLQTPFITSVGPAFFGLRSAEEFLERPYVSSYLDGTEFIKWSAFRKTEASRWIALMFNRFLLRIPYSPEGNPVKTFHFIETASEAACDYVWGNPVWALGSLLVASFARLGWPTEIVGMRTGGRISDLPVRELQTQGDTTIAIPLEMNFPEETHRDLANAGITPLTCGRNTDAAFILSAPTVHLPERYSNARETVSSSLRAQLSYQLLAGRIAHFVGLRYGDIVPGNTPEGIQRDFAAALREFVSASGKMPPDAVRAEIMESPENPANQQLVLHVRPGPEILGGQAAIEMRIGIKR